MYISKVSRSKVIILILYVVDDIFIATNVIGLSYEIKTFFSKNIETNDMGEARYVIGIEVVVIDITYCYAYPRKNISLKF